jgi:hypothetical protein
MEPSACDAGFPRITVIPSLTDRLILACGMSINGATRKVYPASLVLHQEQVESDRSLDTARRQGAEAQKRVSKEKLGFPGKTLAK